MKIIGGFFELEAPAAAPAAHHEGGSRLTSGRAALGAILDQLRPRRLHVPFWVCDKVLTPAHERHMPCVAYALDRRLEPSGAPPARDGELLLYVDYFGLKDRTALRLAAERPVVLDDTQAYFARRPPGVWAFNSIRKYFGVPDGAFLFGPSLPVAPPPRTDVPCDHLVLRRDGQQERAFAAFQANEAAITTAVLGMSETSARLLAGVCHPQVAAARRQNFLRLQRALGAHDELALPLEPDAVPFFYPLLPSRTVDKTPLHRQGIFVPTFWKSCAARPEPGFAWERQLCERLLALPVDHRYDERDMDRVARAVLALLGDQA